MLEAILSAAILVGSVQVSPNVIAEQYITELNGVPVLIEIEEDME